MKNKKVWILVNKEGHVLGVYIKEKTAVFFAELFYGKKNISKLDSKEFSNTYHIFNKENTEIVAVLEDHSIL